MVYLRAVIVLLLGLALLGGVYAQDKDSGKDKSTKEKPKDEAKPPVKIKGSLPRHFGKLGLSESQRQKVLRVSAEYREKIDALNEKLVRLKAERKEAEEKVLTPEQLKRLRELRVGGK